MQIAKINDSNISKYNDLALRCGTIFNTVCWLKMFGDRVNIYGVYDDGGNLIGGFAIYLEKRFGLRIVRNPLFTLTIGPFFEVKAQNPVAVMDFWKEALSLLADFLDKLPCSIISVSLSRGIVDTQPFVWKKFKVVPGYTYMLDLNRSIDDIHSNMSTERRRDISKASRDGLVVKQLDEFQTVKLLVLKSLSKQGLAIDEKTMDKVVFEFANKDNSFGFVTLKDDNPIAASFCVYDKNTAYYILAGYDNKNKHHGAGTLAVWEVIKYAKSLGLKYFDFEGSMVPQIERYLRGFGGSLTPYYRINKAKLPLEILLKFFRRERF